MLIKPTFIIAFLTLALACGTVKLSTQNTVDERVNNIVWGVVSFKGRPLNEANFPNGLPRITFNMMDGKISGMDGCNSFMGIATYKGDRIKTGAIASTKVACADNNIQADFYDILAADNLTWQLDNTSTLRLMANGLEMMALKERQ